MGLRFDETTGSTFVEHEHPVRYREGSRNVTRTCAWSAPGCHLGCGLLVSTDDEGNVVKVEGDPDNPFNDGRLCVRCLDVKEVLYHEDRLKYPMRRVGKRGENKWELITWDEAYGEITAKLFDIRDKYGAESVVFCKMAWPRCVLAYRFSRRDRDMRCFMRNLPCAIRIPTRRAQRGYSLQLILLQRISVAMSVDLRFYSAEPLSAWICHRNPVIGRYAPTEKPEALEDRIVELLSGNA